METYLTRVTDYLLTQSWQIALLVVVIAAVSLVLRNKSAHVRYLLWLIVLAKCLVPPLLTVPVAILPQEKPAMPFEVVGSTISEPPELPSAPVEAAPVSIVRERPTKINIRQWLGAAWLVGAITFLVFNLLKALRASLWLWRQRKVLSAELLSDIEKLFSAHGIKSSPGVWQIDGISQPFVWGLLRGSIYLPADLLSVKNPEHCRNLLGHELSHIIRFDAAVNFLQVVVQAIFWFHPFVWWANKKIRAEREKCCDEMAIARLNASPRDYSTAIVETLATKHESTRPVPSLAVAGPVKNIEERIKTMMKPGKKFYKHPSLPAVEIVVLTALLAVPTTVVLTARAENQPSTDSTGAAPIFGNPTNLGPTVNSSSKEWDPDISSDGLFLYFNSYRPGGSGKADIWVVRRKSTDDPWERPLNLGPMVNSSANETAPSISADGLSLYFGSDRPGGYGDRDLWVTTRNSTSDLWGTPVNLGPTVNSSACEHNPSISADGLSLYFSEHEDVRGRPGGLGSADIWVTTRKSKDEPWGTPVNLGPTVNTSVADGCPSISMDGLSLYFTSRRGYGYDDIWVTTRKTKDAPWRTPVNLGPTVNSSDGEWNPDISSDGSTLYFVLWRSDSQRSDIWQVSLKAEAKPAKSLPQAAKDGDIEQVKVLISQGADVNTKNHITHRTPLHLAARGGHSKYSKTTSVCRRQRQCKESL